MMGVVENEKYEWKYSSSPSFSSFLLFFVTITITSSLSFIICPSTHGDTVWFLYLAALAPSLTNARNPEITTLQIGKSVNCRREEILVWSHNESFVLE